MKVDALFTIDIKNIEQDNLKAVKPIIEKALYTFCMKGGPKAEVTLQEVRNK